MAETNVLENQPVAWTPTPEIVERAQLTRFMRQVGVLTWDELYRFSIGDVENFTAEVLKFLGIKFDPPYEKLLDLSSGPEFPRWLQRSADTPVRTDAASAFAKPPNGVEAAENRSLADKSVRAPSHAGLNITQMCLDRWQTDEMKNQPAVIWEGEEGAHWFDTYKDIFDKVEFCAAGMRYSGIRKGDAVALHMPMMSETVVALLAINRIGAITVPVFSGYGVEAIVSRIQAVGAKALFTCDGSSRRGKTVDMFNVARDAVDKCPTIEKVFVRGRLGKDLEFPDERYIDWFRLLDLEFETPQVEWKDLHYAEPTSAEDPLIILYTSGTTGKPKGIVHTHASFPIKAAQDMAFGTDVGRGMRICWYTDIGWMMGPWLIYGALINGATICLYDGAPDYPTPDRIWEFCARHKVEVLGISPTLIRSLAGRSADTLVRMSAKHEQPRRTEERDNSTDAPARKGWSRHGRLPHFDGNVTQFITFRLADSLPKSVIEKLKLKLQQDKPDDLEEFRRMVEEYLDKGAGDCILNDPAIADIVRTTILNEDGVSCDLKAWVIMPNHVHLLLRLREGHDLAGLMKRLKGVSARKINQQRGADGPVWQADYFDRYIRDAGHFADAYWYIENNPVVAGLSAAPEEWEFSSRSADTPVRMSAKHEHPFAASGDADMSVRAPAGDADMSVRAPAGDADMSVRAPFERHDLSGLRILAATGEPWNPAPWWWLFEKVGNSKVPIINYSGGTEIAGGILMGNPLLPIKPCSFPAPCPGMDVDILDESGEPLKSGEVGELVIKQPWIGMARGFWQEKQRYLETYWSRFPGIWVHGDWAMRDREGFWYILGRSDDTLKIAGKRVGPAEVESILVSHPSVTEAAVIGIPDEQKGTVMVAFCVLARSADTPVRMSAKHEHPFAASGDADRSVRAPTGDADKSVRVPLEQELKALIARDMGKPLVPSRIHLVSALPKTRNAKVMRRVLRTAYLGHDPGDLSALENPQSVNEIIELNK